MSEYVVIHAHFYQPSRENPWLSRVSQEISAHPYHDWNERITEECYRPNALIPIVDREGRVVDVFNNYSWLSFNVGPTLMAWFSENAPDVYEAILEADRMSRRRFSGHGSAIAQVYNHMIMPLASREVKYLAAYWGVEAFKEDFGRPPEGMWLPETAVDDETLDVLAELGIKFTILAPHQASKVKASGGEWIDVSGGSIDVRRPYLYRTSSGRTITLFFYDARLSHGIAFGELLSSGDLLAENIVKAFSGGRAELITIATDGETYGHHKKYGHLALAYALKILTEQRLARVTNFGEFLELSPPQHEAMIVEGTSWSCPHGVERWRNECGCRIDPSRAWSQEWRKHLREAVDWLNNALINLYLSKGSELYINPWEALLNYVSIAGKSEEIITAYLRRVCKAPVSDSIKVKSLKLLEMMRHALLMQSSDGWFFDDISNIEAVQVMRHAARAMELAKEFASLDLENVFLTYLKRAKSNVPELVDGEKIYMRLVKSASIDHYDICVLNASLNLVGPSLGGGREKTLFSYTVNDLISLPIASDMFDAVLGIAVVNSSTTLESVKCVYYAHIASDHTMLGASGPPEGVDIISLKSEILERIKDQDLKSLREFLKKRLTRVRDILSVDFPLEAGGASRETRLFDYLMELLTLQSSKEFSELLDDMLGDPLRLYSLLSLSREMKIKMSDFLSKLDAKLSEQLLNLARKQFDASVLKKAMLSVSAIRELTKDTKALKELWGTRAALCLLIRECKPELARMSRAGVKDGYESLQALDMLSNALNVKCD